MASGSRGRRRGRAGDGARALACGLAVALLAGGARAELFAEQLSSESVPRRAVGGPDAIAGAGDWALGNGTLCAAVSDPQHEAVLSEGGGLLVDLGHCGRGDDQWTVLHSLFELSRSGAPDVQAVGAAVTETEAQVTTLATRDGVDLVTRYQLSEARPRVLSVASRLRRAAPGPPLRAVADIVLHGHAALAPFSLSTLAPERSPGFVHPAVDPDDWLTMLRAASESDVLVFVGAEHVRPGVAYALRLVRAQHVDREGVRRDLPFLSIRGEDFSLLGLLTRPPWLGGGRRAGLLALAQMPWMDLQEGEEIVIERELAVGERADAASALDALFEDWPEVASATEDASARLRVDRRDGGAQSFVRPDAAGGLRFRAPPGPYRLTLRTPDGRTQKREIQLPREGLELEPFGAAELGAPARLRLPRGHAMRLVIRGRDGTADPWLGDSVRRARVGERRLRDHGSAGAISLTGGPLDPEELALPPGRYRVYATRGPEYEVRHTDVSLAAGQTAPLELAAPPRAFDTPGWISADLHLHAVASDDSGLPVEMRVASLVAQGVEVAVATEHDVVVDARATIRELGLAQVLAGVNGCEVTATYRGGEVPWTAGHANAFPLPYQPRAYRGGAPRGEGRRLRGLVRELRDLAGERVLQLNHPRGRRPGLDLGSLFTHLSVRGEAFDPTRALSEEPNDVLVEPGLSGERDLDFDAMELANGGRIERYLRVRADWLSLLLQGERRTATANSDSHYARDPVGLPRNYVQLADDRVAGFDEARFVQAIKRGALIGTTGPWLRVALDEAGPGDLHERPEGQLRVEVQAAPWVPVDELRVYVDARLEHAEPTRAGALHELPLRFERDAFVTVEVWGRANESYTAVAPDTVPFAFANPIFVDADGDGAWSAPGLPEPLPPALADPLRNAR